MKKIATIGAALVDVYLTSDVFAPQEKNGQQVLCQPYGHKIEIQDHEVTTGGAATNVAVALAKRGHDVSIIAELGRDYFATMVKNELVRERVNTAYIIQEKMEKTGCSVIMRGPDGGRTVMVSRSASAMLDDYDIPLEFLSTRDWFHLSSVGGNLNALGEIWKVFDMSDINFSWNPGTQEIKHICSGKIRLPETTNSVFLVNAHEWELAKKKQTDILQAFYYVVVTAGGEGGTVWVQGEEKIHFPAKTAEPAFEETGAGDAFGAAFISTLLYDRPVEEAIVAATNNADSVIRFVGAKKGLLNF